jgi:hypothetical protein
MMLHSGINFWRSIGGSNFDTELEGRRSWFFIFHVKEINKFTRILRLGNTNSFLDLINLETKEMVQKF